MRPANPPTHEYRLANIVAFNYIGKFDNYDITVDTAHEFFANGICVKNCLGKFHSHGDTSVYGATVTLANMSEPPISGQGNWGSIMDPAAAMRYTECRLSKYGDHAFFDPKYLPIIDVMPTYDGKDTEPVILPSLVPNILLNGSFGIAMGGTSHIPSFGIRGVATLINFLLEGKTVGPTECLKHLKFNYQYGGKAILDQNGKDELLAFYKEGSGGIRFKSPCVIDQPNRSITFTHFAPSLNLESTIIKVRNFPFVEVIEDATSIENGPRYTVVLKKSAAIQFLTLSKEVIKCFNTRLSFKVNILSRDFNHVTGRINDDPKVKPFKQTNIPQLLKNWVSWRITLERKSLRHQVSIVDKKISGLNLRIKAAINKDIVLSSLDANDPDSYLAKVLRITREEAHQILEFRIRQLHKWNVKELNKQVSTCKSEISVLNSHLKATNAKLKADLKEFLASM